MKEAQASYVTMGEKEREAFHCYDARCVGSHFESSSPSCHLTEATEVSPREASRHCYDAKANAQHTHGSQRYSTGLWEKKEVYCEVDQQGDRRQGSNLPPQSGVQSHFSELEEEG